MDQEYTRRIADIEAALDRWLPENPGPAWAERVFPGLKKTPVADSLLALTAPGRDLLSRGGKRWRPLLMVLVCESLGGGNAALPLSPLVEFCHNASLIHDDIEDSSDERRGRPAVHLLYGADTAINSGSFLYFLPLSCVGPWAADLVKAGFSAAETAVYQNRVYALWAEYLRKLHLGQAMDINWHRNFSLIPGLDEYYAMCGLKTGCLARFAAELGVCAAEAAQSTLKNSIFNHEPHEPHGQRHENSKQKSVGAGDLGEAAEKLGVGFQILDDVKNLTTGIPGKKRGDDVVEGKKSLPLLLYLRRYPEQRDMVSRCFSAARSGGLTAPEVEELIAALESSGALDEAQKQGLALIAEARQAFAAPPAGTLLAGLAELIS